MVMRKQAGPPGEDAHERQLADKDSVQVSGISGHVNKKAGKGTGRAAVPASSATTGPIGSGRKGRKGKKIAGQRSAAGNSAAPGDNGTSTGTDTGTATGTGTGRRADAGAPAGQVIVLSEEQLRVITQTKQRGRVRLSKTVVTENVSQTITIRREEIRIDRGPGTDTASAVGPGMDSAVDTGADSVVDAGATSGVVIDGSELDKGGYSIVLSEERPVVRMETVAVKRIRLSKDMILTEETLSADVRKEVLEPGTTDDPHSGTPAPRSTDDYAG